MKENINKLNKFLLDNYSFRLVQCSDNWVEYTDGLKTLFVDHNIFHYYFNSSELAAPITCDIITMVYAIRYIIFNLGPQCNIIDNELSDKIMEVVYSDEKH